MNKPELALVEAPPAEEPLSERPELHLIQGEGLPEAGATVGRPDLFAVPEPGEQATDEEAGRSRLVNADHVPELAAKRQKAAQHAAGLLARNRQLFKSGAIDQVPVPVDPLGTARQVIEGREKYGEDSPEYKELFKGMLLDSVRLIGEAYTKNEPEHFERAPHNFHPETGEYISHGLSVSNMTRNGLTPMGESEEQRRRVGEVVEEDGTYVPIGDMIVTHGLGRTAELLRLTDERYTSDVRIEATTVSMCTDYAERDYAANPKGSFGGYRPAMRGIAIRRMHYEGDAGHREQEQVIIAGPYIDEAVISEEMAARGAIKEGKLLTKDEIHATQLISLDDGSVMNFAQALDERAGRKHDKNLFMGEEVADNHPKDYEAFISEAQERRVRREPLPQRLAEFTLELQERGVDKLEADKIIRKWLKDELLAVAKQQPELAEAMFDEATAEGFKEVAQLESDGMHDEAYALQVQIEQDAPEPDYCSGGGGGSSAARAAMEKAQQANNLLNEKDWHGGEVHFFATCVSCDETKGVVGACYICEDCVHSPKEK